MAPLTLAFLLLAASLPSGGLRAEVSVVDDAGTTLRLARPAQRIVSLAPHLTETLFAAGAGGRVVGTVEYSNFPPAAANIARVGGYSQIDLERVVALKPDLVIAWQSGNAAAHLDRLRALGLPVYLSQPDRIEDVASEIERFGVLAGSTAMAARGAADFRERLAQLQRRYSRRPPVRTFYQIWKQPLMTVGGKQIISDVIHLCGGENVFARLETMAPTVTVEAVIAANPEAIVASGMGESRPEWLDDWQRWTSLTAVARGNLFFVPPDLIQRHTPRLLDGAEELCRQLETARNRRP
ncbi:MAG: cobalamin-binding protein [Candidatus Accumulibacter sp.]|uniref:cobalamin-binding protein n=1 Tax=Accumulibacter sp. TaxID=2053492 RepID=UPI0019EA7FB5|nr:cobalamin-binding protein [Accumulibacter sp.]MBE2259135.1 cobalamin-binding protein [Paracoccaceae bacterium]MCP5247608.1 cobalamin-binding protein [Accumulibacter sp.]